MEMLYNLFKKPGEHRFPFELLEHFDLESVQELGDVTSGQVFREIVFLEKGGQPAVYLRRSFQDYPMQGIPTRITFQRNLLFYPQHGLCYCHNYADLATRLHLRKDIKQFLSNNYEIAEARDRTHLFGRRIA